MDMLVNLSLYPINALATTHEANQSRRRRAVYHNEEEDLMLIPQIEIMSSSTASPFRQEIDYRSSRKQTLDYETFYGNGSRKIIQRFPLSYRQVLSWRY
ncbi:hypothetical protein LJC49_05590 [Ruminococcaceae bacterium OttesenSCG-928-I18]|nr:hypothetical protein [Ruminococcaceae bacterium OttesenSCG-928-I18]